MFQLIIIFLIIMLGIFSLIKIKKEQKMREIFSDIKLFAILPLFDVLSTILFTSKHGISAEFNPIGRFFMENLGGLGFIVMYLFSVSIWILFIISIKFISIKYPSKNETKKESYLKTTSLIKGVAIGVYMIIIFYNLLSLTH